MIRATTPTHTFDFGTKFNLPVELSKVLISYYQNGSQVLEKEKSDLSWSVGRDQSLVGSVTLTQAETKLFSPLYDVEIQVRVLTSEGDALAGPIVRRKVFDVLDDEVLTDA